MNGGRDMDRREKMKTNYRKECTIVVEVGDNQKIAAGELINFLTQRFGDIIHACVPKGPDRFEITVDDLIQARIIADSEILELNGVRMKSRLLHSESVVVSFLHLPAYITDEEIEERLKSLNVKLVSPIYRRFYKGTHIADGTRYVRVKFPPNIKSLPYSMKFKTVEGVEYFKVLHNNQLKVCYNCMSDSHVIKDCPNIQCHYCKEKGHYARNCNKTFLCDKCGNKEEDCSCSINEGDQGWISYSESESECERKEEHQATAENKKLQQHTGEENSHKDRTPVQSAQKEQRKTSVQQLTERYEQHRVKLKPNCENKDADAEKTDHSQQRKTSRRSRLIKRPADDNIWSVVTTRKQKREAARAKGIDESMNKRRMSEGENVDMN